MVTHARTCFDVVRVECLEEAIHHSRRHTLGLHLIHREGVGGMTLW